MSESKDDLVKVYVGANTLELHTVRNSLEAQGIQAIVLGEHLDTARGDLSFTANSLLGVWVHCNDIDKAKIIIDEFESKQQQE